MANHADLDTLSVNALRRLAVDAVQKAQSGHPGTPMDAAPTAYTLWQRVLRRDPADPGWLNCDRFLLSSGCGSMLLYGLIHLAGVRAVNATYDSVGEEAMTLHDIETFRQDGGRCCPGHPEYGWTSGVETTMGPLGQGVATSTGMAIGGKWLAATYNRPDFDIFDFNVYVLCGDSEMMEGVASEAASMAGHLTLINPCWIYDSNRVTAEGHTNLTFREDVAACFLAYGWSVKRVIDANDLSIAARELLGAAGTRCRVVRMAPWELFEEQPQAYRDVVLPPSVTARVTVEEASPIGWDRYAGARGAVLGMRTFGLSAPTNIVAAYFGFAPDLVADAGRKALARDHTSPA